ncbi:DUF3841 domain-containing protein [Exiguobacterium sp. SH5S13]|uniref:DUF3841 domain-containing protein n=1 Tax=Exiguobacterium sp. SH5S13 TaxID=2510959 RepID=UPI001039CFC9|nr:DUF3841 domain-containing protein [Exiguobacterium sp. SH5S13]TCI56199.1 DUF3841 domain-containing protein [Exiguobacterium sp. SH5S13]
MGIYYTCQHEGAWKVALERGYLAANSDYVMFKDGVSEMFEPAYGWMVDQYERRIGISLNGNYPIWCWDVFPEGTLDGYVNPGEQGVVLTVELPDEHVLSSEALYWDVVTMQGSLHDRVEDYDSGVELTLAEKKKAWEKIFDKDWCYAHAMPTRMPEYQHVIHRIELHQVRAVIPFTGRGDDWIDRLKHIGWRFGYRVGWNKSIPFHYQG